jgi:hypothetical protein
MQDHTHRKQKSQAKVASLGLEHIINGRPVRLALHEGVQLLHQPGQENMDAALKAHANDHIHQIEHAGNHEEPFRLTSPRNKANTPLSLEQKFALKDELNSKVNLAKNMQQEFKDMTKKRYDNLHGKWIETRPHLPVAQRGSQGDPTRRKGNRRMDRFERNKPSRFKPY